VKLLTGRRLSGQPAARSQYATHVRYAVKGRRAGGRHALTTTPVDATTATPNSAGRVAVPLLGEDEPDAARP
jgi:hypothetical protein